MFVRPLISMAYRRSRWWVATLVAYQAFFLNVLLPVHTRGTVTLDGQHHPVRSCCCCGGMSAKASKPGTPSQQDKSECALCHFAACAMPAPVLAIALPQLALVDHLPLLLRLSSSDQFCTPVYFACGPPIGCC